MLTVAPEGIVSPLTVMTCPATDTEPTDDVTYPAVPATVDGAVHPAGTETTNDPPERPPAAAVYVSVTVTAELAGSVAGATVAVPEPFALVVILNGGEVATTTSADVDTMTVCDGEANGGLTTPATTILIESPAVTAFGTVNVAAAPPEVTLTAVAAALDNRVESATVYLLAAAGKTVPASPPVDNVTVPTPATRPVVTLNVIV